MFGDQRNVGYEQNIMHNELLSVLEETKKVLSYTDNAYNQNKLIEGFNKFAVRYHKAYNEYLYKKAYTPNWVLTGRGNLNVNSYNKKQDQLQNKLKNLVDIIDKQRTILKKYSYRFKRDSVQREKEVMNHAINNIEDITLSFQTEKREIEYCGFKCFRKFRIKYKSNGTKKR